MKKFLLALTVALVGLTASAQKGQPALGINLGYGTETESLGIGIKAQYFLTNSLRAEASANYFFEKDNLSMWDLNLNAHYLFKVANKLSVYPIVGMTLANFDSHGNTKSRIGVNLGGGIEHNLTRNISINAEAKYQLVNDFDQGVFSIGAAYRF